MTNNKIIYKAVLKAETNGYKNSDIQYFLDNNLWEMFLFDIDFAKAFFGEEDMPSDFIQELFSSYDGFADEYHGRKWQYHLQQMVILEENERIKYLRDFL